MKGAIIKVKLYSAKISINNVCNLHCDYCLLDKTRAPQGLDLNSWLEILFKLKQLGAQHIDFFGKEPLYDRKAFDIIELAQNRGLLFDYHMITNGKNIEKYFEEIVCYLSSLTVSYSGVTTSGRKFIPDFSLIQKLISKGVRLELSVDVQRANISDLPKFITRFKDMGISCLYFKPILGYTSKAKLFEVSEEEYSDFCDYCLSLKPLGIQIDIDIPYTSSFLTNKYKDIPLHANGNIFTEPKCVCDGSFLYIESDGYAYPCGECSVTQNFSRRFDFLRTPLQEIPPLLVSTNGERLCKVVKK